MTAVEPGGVIVVRFASDGAERKLMADYAPMQEGELMAATVIDGKAVAAAVRERVARRGRRAHRSSSAGRRAWRRCWSATTRPRRSTCAASTRPARRSGSAPSTTSPTRSIAQDELLDLVGELERRRRGRRDPRPAAAARPDRPDAVDRRDRPRQGRRRPDAGQRRAARPRGAGPGALHAAGRDGAARLAGVDPEGAEAVIVGRSNLVGRPLFSLLLGANATVTVCHTRTRDLGEVCRRADILVAAVGRRGWSPAR